MILRASLGFCALLALAMPASAQNRVNPSDNWNSSWGFTTPAEETLKLLQADTIKKAGEGYYDNIGTPSDVFITYNTDNRSGVVEVTAGDNSTIDVTNHTGDEIGQNTNVIGAINNSTTTIDVSGNGNTVTATSGANSVGCQDGSINIGTTSSSGQEASGGDSSGSSGAVTFSSGTTSCN